MSQVRRAKVDGRAILVLIGLCALWGLQQVAIKLSLGQGLPPFFQAAFRSGVAALMVVGWIAIREKPGALVGMLSKGSARWPGLLIAMVFALEFLVIYPGLRLTTAARGVLFLYTAPFFTAIGAHLFLPGGRLGVRQMLGLLVAFGGVAIAFAHGLSAGGGSIRGDLMCGAAAMLWGAATVIMQANPKLRKLPSAQLLLYQLGGSAPVLLAAAILAGDLDHFPDASALAWISLLYQTVVVAFASYLAWFWLVSVYPATQIAGFTFLTPLFGILAGSLLLGEPTSAALFAGLAAIAVGMRLLR